MVSTKENLKAFGLLDKEVAVYLQLLKSGILTPLELSRLTKINRTSIYRAIEKLVQKGLITEKIEQNSTKYCAMDPEYLNTLLKEEKNRVLQIETFLPNTINDLENLRNEGSAPVSVKYYRGIEGLKQVLWNILKSNDGKGVVGYARDLMENHMDAVFMENWRDEICKRNIVTYEITNTPEEDYVWTKNKTYVEKHYKQRYIAPTILNTHHINWIYNDTLTYYYANNNDYWAVEIVNKEIADVQRQIFWILWEKGVEMESFRKFIPEL
jgi:predicted transcriptional regulator